VRALRRWRELCAGDRVLLLRAVAWLAAVRLMLSALPFQRVRDWTARASGARRPPAHSAEKVRWAVLVASRWLPGTRCLPRALVLEALLRQTGLSCDLRIGVAKDADGALVAHAWVDHEGAPFLPDEDLSSYAPLSPLPQ
jgi:hypothetical protein